MPGLYEHDEEEGWQPFRPFTSHLNRDMRDPNLKFVDLDGDGHADVLISEDDAFVWHASLAEQGFGPARRVHQTLDEEKGPRLVFADGTQSIYLADLSGDGLTDLVRIRNGEVCYWPNLGYGRFGAKVTMDQAPHFDHPDQFDHKRIRLADIDGTGTTDIIYLHRDGVRLYFNQSGNSWGKPQPLRLFPRVDDLVSIIPTDLLGNGTACLVWSSPLPGDARRQMRYVDLMGGQKPHLLISTKNNLGAETRVAYAPSTKFYLQDKRDGKPWITRLPFPVHVIERVETYDRISRNRFVTRYKYHHGCFDGEEREFRGFGMVEQWDTEELAALTGNGTLHAATNIDTASHVPPVLTKTWFHTGVYLGRDHISDFFAGIGEGDGEYYREPALRGDAHDPAARALLLADTILPEGLSADEEREACRALKGAMLRQEVYALDGTPKAAHPYTVTEQNFTIRRLQPRDDNRHAVFFTHAREAINFHYERNPADPRIGHSLVLDVDPFGNVKKSVAIGYGRRLGQSPLTGNDKKKQEQLLITYTESDYTENDITNPADWVDANRTPLPAETRTYELTGYKPANNAKRFSFDEWIKDNFALLKAAVGINYEETADLTKKQKRLIEHVRTLYRKNDLTGLLPLTQLKSLALPGESYKLAFTPELAKQIYVDSGKLTLIDLNGALANEGKYVHSENDSNWWIPSGRMFYARDTNLAASQELAEAQKHFFLPRRFRDPFTHDTFVEYDIHDLLPLETEDALSNKVTAGERSLQPDGSELTKPWIDYRVLQPKLVTDPNRNRTEVTFDTLGMVVGTAVMGKPLPAPVEGDSLDGFVADLSEAVILDHLANPLTDPHAILGRATTRLVYDLFAYQRTKNQPDPQPAVVYTLIRETHDSDPVPVGGLKIQHSFSYSDGFGREIQKKIQAEPGPVPRRDANGKIIVGPDGRPEMTSNDVSPRWVGSGWTIFNNKGKPVRQYEPFFSATHRFEFGVQVGVSPILFYDPVERVVATLHPNHTWEKVVFDPWRQVTYDVNDTVLVADPKTDADVGDFFSRLANVDYLPTWHALRTDPANALAANQRWPDPKTRDAEKRAAEKVSVHAATPTVAHADSLGRTFLTVAHNKFKYSDSPPADPPVEEFHSTRIILDIEGNQREVIDAKDRVVMRYDYDMLGSRIKQRSMEAGTRWMLNDVAGKPIYGWDSRNHRVHHEYDELRRPVRLFMRTGTAPEKLAERTVYGERHPDSNQPNLLDRKLNLRGKLFMQLDGAGVIINVARNTQTNVDEAYDFKGNLLRSKRQLATEYKQQVNWLMMEPLLSVTSPAVLNLTAIANALAPLLETATFTSSTSYDALNRPLTATSPDGSVYRPTFNEANLLDKVDVNLRGAAAATPFVTNINYNAKGQRVLIEYGSGAGPTRQGVTTIYEYDENTFRLIHLKTTRPANPDATVSQLFQNATVVQGLRYTYDPVGNFTRVEDAALKTVFHGQQVDPAGRYTYDALYRLIEAQGREHIGQTAFDFNPPNGNYRDYPFVGHRHPNDLQALRNYTERYEYDAVGNFKVMHHLGQWTRTYDYNEKSLIEAGKQSNRLSRTALGNGLNRTETYTHDAHGNMTRMPHLGGAHPAPNMHWDYRDQLRQTDLGGGGTAYYVYDAAGQRVRKVWEKSANLVEERIYLGGFEIYRRRQGAERLERETLHLMDDKQRIALVETKTKDTGVPANTLPETLTRYQFGNHLGSASLELDDQAQIISYEEYIPYGSTSYQAVNKDIKAAAKRYRYTGKERDEESGLYYYGARYYAPWLGKWCSCDPDRRMNDLNAYMFVRNNPTMYIDIDGYWPIAKDAWDAIKNLGVLGERRHSYSPGTHQGITFEAYNKSEFQPKSEDFKRGLIKGVKSIDAPAGEVAALYKLIIEPKVLPYQFYTDKDLRETTSPGDPTLESHYGNPHWHSMSAKNETADETKQAISNQLSEWYDSALSAKSPKEQGDYMGKILHTLQDSWSPAHVDRDLSGSILGFQNYDRQDPDAHTKTEHVDVNNPDAVDVSVKALNAFGSHDKEDFMRVVNQNYRLGEGAKSDYPGIQPLKPNIGDMMKRNSNIDDLRYKDMEIQ